MNSSELRNALARVRNRPSFFAELIGENGFKLLLGLGQSKGCVQFSSVDGSAPYFMALEFHNSDSLEELSFLIGDTLTPVPGRFGLPYESVEKIAVTFLETGQRSGDVHWEEI